MKSETAKITLRYSAEEDDLAAIAAFLRKNGFKIYVSPGSYDFAEKPLVVKMPDVSGEIYRAHHDELPSEPTLLKLAEELPPHHGPIILRRVVVSYDVPTNSFDTSGSVSLHYSPLES